MVRAGRRRLSWGVVVFFSAVLGEGVLWAASPNEYRDSVVTFYDNVLRHGRDGYGKKTPLFADGIDVETKTPMVAANGDVICNFAFQQYLLRGLVGLSTLTGEQKYRRAACDATDYVLKNLVNARSGLIHWGCHVSWDLKTDGPRFHPHNSHELKQDFPYYEFLYEVNPQATTRFIESYWNAHVDLDDPWMMFGRHAHMERPGPRGKAKPGELAFTLSAACLIQGLLDLYEAEGDDWYVEAARGVADDALNHFFTGDFFVDWPNEFPSSRVNQSLPLAMLRLYAVLNKSQVALPQDVGGYGMSASNPNDISQNAGDFALRFMWARHHVDIGGENLSARVGDSFPHSKRHDGIFDYPGVWRLSSPHFSGNVLDSTKGMVFEPLWRAFPWGVRRLSDREARIEHWQFRSGPVKRPYLGIRMNYRISTPDSLDWTLEITPLEEGYGDLSLRAKAYLNTKASPQFTFLSPDGFTGLNLSESKEILVKSQTGVAESPHKYRQLFYSRIEDAVLVFMFKPGEPIDLLAAGPSQDDAGGLRGFVWHIADAKKDEVYRLCVRLKIIPSSRTDELISHYEQWCAATPTGNATKQ